MSILETPVLTDSWMPMDWDEFVRLSESPALERAKGYFFRDHGKFEMLPTGFNHSADHTLTSTAVSLYPTPDLAIEIAKTSLLDDMGAKRSLRKAIGVAEYWIVDVKKAEVLAFRMSDRGSQRIETSVVLPGFQISVLEEALRLSRKENQTQVGGWLMQQFQI